MQPAATLHNGSRHLQRLQSGLQCVVLRVAVEKPDQAAGASFFIHRVVLSSPPAGGVFSFFFFFFPSFCRQNPKKSSIVETTQGDTIGVEGTDRVYQRGEVQASP